MPKLFFGKKGLRAGWRLAIYLGILCALGYGAVTIAGKLAHGQQAGQGDAVTLIETFALALAIALVAAWVMARIEHSSIADYSLPWRKALQGNFWIGAIVGFAALTLLLVVLKLAGFYSFGARQLHGADAALSGVLWAAAVLLAAIFEDFLYRGYLLSNLASAFGFWPSAAITSLLMAAAHIMNPGWTVLGLVTIFEYGMLACFLLRRSGSLWLPIGLHTAWNWGETYFYGIPCSGLMGQKPAIAWQFSWPFADHGHAIRSRSRLVERAPSGGYRPAFQLDAGRKGKLCCQSGPRAEMKSCASNPGGCLRIGRGEIFFCAVNEKI